MLSQLLNEKNIILASGSPRRQAFFAELDLEYTIQIKPIDESFPDTLRGTEITDYLAQQKAAAFTDLQPKDIVITSDTIVWFKDKALNKPENKDEAFAMISSLSGNTHQVMTSVCFTSLEKQITVNDTTNVSFKKLSPDEINYYIDNYQPYDKAGGYGIQEWFGYIAVTKIEGSHFNVMGLPTHKVYETLMQLAE